MNLDELLNPRATTWEGRPMQDDDEVDLVTDTVLLRGILLRVTAEDNTWPTKEAEAIFEHHLAEWARLFLMKNLNYRAVRHLGSRGVFPDINRKVGVLEDRVWNGNMHPLGEPTTEVIYDAIGHLFMMAAFLEEEDNNDV
jgi:hypothetical protein